MISGVLNHALASGSLMDKSGFGGCRTLPTKMYSASSKVWRRRDYELGLKGDFNATAYKDILHTYLLLQLYSYNYTLQCPAQSHDLIPTEHLCDELEQRL